MKEYIEREAVLRIIDKYGCGNGSVLGYHSGAVDCAGSEIARIPAADVVEVRHGRWRLNCDGSGTCSECGRTQNDVWDFDNWQRYCGCCGCKMDKEE